MSFIERRPSPALSSSTEVLDSVVGLNGTSLLDIMNELRENEIRLIMLFGPPKSGKTTISTQLAQAIREDPNTFKTAELIRFDDAIRDAQTKYGLGTVTDWQDQQWTTASMHYYHLIEDRLAETDPGRILIAENVGVGKTDRGVSTLKKIASSHAVDTFYIGVVNDPRISERAVGIRRALLKTDPNGNFIVPDEYVVDYFASNNLIIAGTENMDPTDAGRSLRDSVSKMDLYTDPHKIAETLDEEEAMMEAAGKFMNVGLPQGRTRYTELEELALELMEQTRRGESGRLSARLPQEVMGSGLSSEQLSLIHLQLAYFINLGIELGLSKHRFKIVFNTYLKGVKIHYLDLADSFTKSS